MILKLLVIVGPTASGKTALAIDIAKKYRGEIIAADSRTIYKYMDIGTAKPSLIDRQNVPHWGFDLADHNKKMSVADFKDYADKKIKEIKKRGNLPILVGGSGLYIDAVVYDFSFAPANEKLRQRLSKKTVEELQQKIIKLGLKIPENRQNKRYLIRTLERGNISIAKKTLDPKTLIIGINPGRQILKARITERAHQMIKDGVVDEIKLAANQYGWKNEAMTGGIYRIFKPFVEGKIGQTEAIQNFISSDMQLAKKQMTWFKRNPDIKWFESVSKASDWLDNYIRGKL